MGMVHWDGSRWSPVTLTPLVTPGWIPGIGSVATAPDGRIWAVGLSSDPGQTSRAPSREGGTEPLVLVNAAAGR
jgi:hypothetical protein